MTSHRHTDNLTGLNGYTILDEKVAMVSFLSFMFNHVYTVYIFSEIT